MTKRGSSPFSLRLPGLGKACPGGALEHLAGALARGSPPWLPLSTWPVAARESKALEMVEKRLGRF
jgi:hypothetical protein